MYLNFIIIITPIRTRVLDLQLAEIKFNLIIKPGRAPLDYIHNAYITVYVRSRQIYRSRAMKMQYINILYTYVHMCLSLRLKYIYIFELIFTRAQLEITITQMSLL